MITYVRGDATHPGHTGEHRYITHCVNDKGGWGAGFVTALNKVSDSPREAYWAWKDQCEGLLPLGEIQTVYLNADTTVVNLVGQRGTKGDHDHPVRYDAIYDGLVQLAALIRAEGEGAVHMPRMGAGLAGGSWPVIEALINEAMPDIDVFVYDWTIDVSDDVAIASHLLGESPDDIERVSGTK
jgi:O-acetyl-ADP-ribose deacetylase (regulator of RNase III)